MWDQSAIIAGKGRGKYLGFPTLNLVIPKNFDKQFGIYAGLVEIGGVTHKGAFHYGPVATFDENTPSLEVFVLNQTLTITPDKIRFKLLHFLREPKKFGTSQELVAQIKRDVEQVARLLQQQF